MSVIILNKTRRSSERYALQMEPMGCYGRPENDPSHRWRIVRGVDRGNGFQGYYSLHLALEVDWMPEEVKAQIRKRFPNI